MKYLLDTHVFLWWLAGDKRLKDSWREVIGNPSVIIFVSVVTAWEMSLKLKTGKLRLKQSLAAYFRDFDFKLLAIELEHVLTFHKLPLHHKDPFDRMLIAQTKVEECTFITDD